MGPLGSLLYVDETAAEPPRDDVGDKVADATTSGSGSARRRTARDTRRTDNEDGSTTGEIQAGDIRIDVEARDERLPVVSPIVVRRPSTAPRSARLSSRSTLESSLADTAAARTLAERRVRELSDELEAVRSEIARTR